MSDTVGFAILGAGMIAEYHQKAIEAAADLGARLVAIGHYNPDRFAEVSARFGVPCLTEAEILARADVDVVCIATPSGQHPAQSIAAARAGKHVLVEKPMALTLADADAMIAAAREAGVQLGVILQRRAEPVFRRARAAIQAGDLGELTLGLITMPYFRPQRYYGQAAWRGTWAMDGGGVLMNQGIHIVDILVWLMGDPVEIQATGGTLQRAIEVEDTVSATLRFANGARATVTATTTAAPGFPHRIEVYGTGGAIQLEGESVVRWTLVDPSTAQVEPLPPTGAAGAGGGADPRGISTGPHGVIVREFVEALRDGRPPVIDGQEGRRGLAAVLGIYEAAGLLPITAGA
ncbi:MAG: Gfo/Idh/MocA family oxidoreductase [Chloroflexi bacterium]|nr:Gfo/Idh/MocA family oxidoreductase [Chloroflexota bacterium]